MKQGFPAAAITSSLMHAFFPVHHRKYWTSTLVHAFVSTGSQLPVIGHIEILDPRSFSKTNHPPLLNSVRVYRCKNQLQTMLGRRPSMTDRDRPSTAVRQLSSNWPQPPIPRLQERMPASRQLPPLPPLPPRRCVGRCLALFRACGRPGIDAAADTNCTNPT